MAAQTPLTDPQLAGTWTLDPHLQAADFFDAERFPEIVVELTGTAPDGELAADRRARRDRPHSLGRQRQHARHDAARHHSGGRGRLRPLTRPGVVASAACPDRCIC